MSVDEVNHRLASHFKVLGNGIRIEVLEYLLDVDEAYLGEISDQFDRSNQTMSNHLTKLCDYDFVRGKSKGRKRYFRVKRTDLVEACLAIKEFLERSENL